MDGYTDTIGMGLACFLLGGIIGFSLSSVLRLDARAKQLIKQDLGIIISKMIFLCCHEDVGNKLSVETMVGKKARFSWKRKNCSGVEHIFNVEEASRMMKRMMEDD